MNEKIYGDAVEDLELRVEELDLQKKKIQRMI